MTGEFGTKDGPLIVFVCTANMCRSPMAEYLLKDSLEPGSTWRVVSAGTDAPHGMPPSYQAVQVLKEWGIEMDEHRSDPLTREVVDDASVIIVMTTSHAARIRWRFPDAEGKVRLLKSFLRNSYGNDTDIPDPIGLSDVVYRGIRDLMKEAMPTLIDYVENG